MPLPFGEDGLSSLLPKAEPLFVVRNLGELRMVESNSSSNRSVFVFLPNSDDAQAAKRLKGKIKKVAKSML